MSLSFDYRRNDVKIKRLERKIEEEKDDLKKELWKIDLDEKTLNNLKRNNILYDKNEFGEFFQIYSEPILTGFFFEIGQRKQNYKGYGESNATHRIKSLQNYYDERKSA